MSNEDLAEDLDVKFGENNKEKATFCLFNIFSWNVSEVALTPVTISYIFLLLCSIVEQNCQQHTQKPRICSMHTHL